MRSSRGSWKVLLPESNHFESLADGGILEAGAKSPFCNSRK
jgi:hypothetical protein